MEQQQGKRQDSAAYDFATKVTNSRTPSHAPTLSPNASRLSSPTLYHKPNTNQNETSVYALTLSLSPSISVPLDQMRTEYFPKHLNKTPAHVTLFHALPCSQIDAIKADLECLAMTTKPYHVSTGRPYRMRRGVAVLLGSGGEHSQHLREELRERWETCLSEQDRGNWHPHWTVMNKVEEEKKVEQAFNTIRRVLFDDVHHGKAVGLNLWRYDAGMWEWMKEYRFTGSAKTPNKTSDEEKGKGYFDLKPRKSGHDKSPGVLKKVAGIWKSITMQKGVGHGNGR